MAHFAHINEQGIVDQVLVGGDNFLDPQFGRNPNEWVQTSYNTKSGVHVLGGTPLRKNYAGVGYTYDKERDAFIPPKRFDSWVLNEEKCIYEAPVEYPNDGKNYKWSEESVAWVESNESVEANKVTPK